LKSVSVNQMIDESKMTLAVDMTGNRSVRGWLGSEKLNGCRAFWDGEKFWTRGGNVVEAPRWFTRGLPEFQLDGEIHAGRGRGFGNDNSAFKLASAAVRFGGNWFDETDDGHPITFTAFDAPEVSGNWLRRLREIPGKVRIAPEVIRDIHHFTAYLLGLKKIGAEGAMFRNPESVGYETGRSENLLRFKYEK